MGAFVAFDMIKRAGEAVSGARVLVLGASGAIGTVLLQLLRKHNGHVTAVCSGANAETVRRMGAHEAIDYTQKAVAEQLAAADKFAVVFDLVGGKEAQHDGEALLKPGGLYITAVGDRQWVGDRHLSCCEWFG